MACDLCSGRAAIMEYPREIVAATQGSLPGMPEMRYAKYLVYYLDILGFKEAVRESLADEEKVRSIGSILETAKKNIARASYRPVSDRTHARMFSDTIVLSCPDPEPHEALALHDFASELQAMMVERDYFLRGAAVVGDHYENVEGDVMFGPAIIEAFEMEQRLAGWPRVLIQPGVLSAMRFPDSGDAPNRLGFLGEPARDTDGLLYIDYVMRSFLTATHDKWTAEMWDEPMPIRFGGDFLSLHKSAILKQVDSGQVKRDARRMSKYHTLASYHNATIDRLCSEIPDAYEPSRLERGTPWHKIWLFLGYSLLLSQAKWVPEHISYDEMAKSLREMMRRLSKGSLAQRSEGTEKPFVFPPEVRHIPTERVWEFVNAKLGELCSQKDVLRGKRIDLQTAFPGLY
jgi:hypothetical protein